MTIDIESVKASLLAENANSDNALLKEAVSALTYLQGQIQVLNDENKELDRRMGQQFDRAREAEDKLYVLKDVSDLERIGIYPGTTRPSEGQRVNYFFEPFGKWYSGTYHMGSVSGSSGFTSWLPEVLFWSANYSKDDAIVIDSLVDKISKLTSDIKRFKIVENALSRSIDYDLFFNSVDATIDYMVENNIETREGLTADAVMRDWKTIGIQTRLQTGKTTWAKRLLKRSSEFALLCRDAEQHNAYSFGYEVDSD